MAGVSLEVLINALDLHTVEAVGVVAQHAFALGHYGVVGGVPRHGQPFGDRATVRCATTIPDRAHRKAVRDSFVRGAAAREVSWRHT